MISSKSRASYSFKGTEYFYQHNIQGDVTALALSTGVVVTRYVYDAWGNVVSMSGSLSSTIGEISPVRYRGFTRVSRSLSTDSLRYVLTQVYRLSLNRDSAENMESVIAGSVLQSYLTHIHDPGANSVKSVPVFVFVLRSWAS